MSQSPYHVVTGGNAAACYSAEKCREAIRLFIFVKPDVFVIYDRIVSVKPDQRKVFLLHTVNKPENLPGGILKSTAGNGALFLKSVLPVHSAVELIGGPGREFWTGGQNYPLNEDGKIRAKIQQKGSVADTWLGSWRTEITFAEDKEKAVFLTVLQTADNTETSMIPVENISDEDFDGVQFTAKDGITAVIRFSRDERISAFIRLEKDGAILTNSVFSPLSDRK